MRQILVRARLIFFCHKIESAASSPGCFSFAALLAGLDQAPVEEISQDRLDTRRREHDLGANVLRIRGAEFDHIDDVALIPSESAQQIAMLRFLLPDATA